MLAVTAAHAETIVTYPPWTVLENIAIAPNGDLFVTEIFSGTVFRVSPTGSSSVFGTAPGELAGIARNTDGTLVAAGGKSVYRFEADGTPTLVTEIAEAGFLNGVTILRPDRFLIADDTASLIWEVNISTGIASPWLSSDLLIPPDDGLPFGANGIKLFNGAAYISNTGAGTIVRVPIKGDGSAGTPKVYASDFQVDDFAFGIDGSIFAATQLGEILRLMPDGTRTTILTGTLGDASVAFGRTAADRHAIYVVNNGGAFLGLPEGPLDASIVRIYTDTTGVIPEWEAVPEPSSLWLGGVGAAFLLAHRRRRD
jgi:sugar lactone lactonase YvrE